LTFPQQLGAMSKSLSFPLHRDALHTQIADRIEQMIITQSLSPGDRLPGERDLAEGLDVSRAVVREALRTLSGRGLINVRPGSGAYVQEPSPQHAAAPLELLLRLQQRPDVIVDVRDIRDLFEIRRTLEIEIAGFAAKRATAEDLAAMEASIEHMVVHIDATQRFMGDDQAFHLALANATQNRLFSVLLTPISGLLVRMCRRYATRTLIEVSLSKHRQILDRVEEKDPRGAREIMRDHIDEAERMMVASWEEDEEEVGGGREGGREDRQGGGRR